jgi:hypothetical protein
MDMTEAAYRRVSWIVDVRRGSSAFRDELVEMVFDFLTGILLLPGYHGLISLIDQRLKTLFPLEVKDDQPVPRVGSVRHQTEQESNKESPGGFRILESNSISNPKFTVEDKREHT